MAPPPASSRATPATSDSDSLDLLSLVNDSMSYMNPTATPSAPPSNASTTDDSSISPSTPKSEDQAEGEDEEDEEDPLANIDLSTLSVQDRALLQPLLDLLQPPVNEDEESESDLARRMDEAENVASGLEGQLDSLLAKLGGILGEEGLDLLDEEEDAEWEDDKEGEGEGKKASESEKSS